MAKRCEVCNRTYPDTEPTCPYCAEAVEVVETVDNEPTRQYRAAATEVIDVGLEDLIDSPDQVPAEIEVVEEAEAEPAAAPPPEPAPRVPTPTMLAPAGAEPDVIVEPDRPAADRPPPAEAPVTAAADEGIPTQPAPRPAPPTQEAPRAPTPTMLAPLGAAEEIDWSAVADEPPPQAKARPAEERPVDADVRDLLGEEALTEGPSGLDIRAETAAADDVAAAAREEEVRAEEEAAELLADESSAVNLGAPAAAGPRAVEEDLGIEPEALAAGEPVEEPAYVVDEELPARAAEPESEVTRDRPPRARTGKAVAGGALVGALGAGAVAAGLYFAGFLHLGTGDKSGTKTGGGSQVAPSPVAQKTPLQTAHEHMDQGEYDKAVEALANENAPEALALRAEARWMNYLRTRKAENKPVSADDEAVKQTLADLAAAKDARAAADRQAQINDLLAYSRLQGKGGGGDNQPALEAVRNALKDRDVKDLNTGVTQVVQALQKAKEAADRAQRDQEALKADKDQLAKKVKDLDEAKNAADAKLQKVQSRVEAALAGGKGKDLDEAVDLLAADKKKAETERARLDALVKAVRAKLQEAKQLPANADSDEALLSSVDKAVKQGGSPLGSAVGSMANALAGAGETVGRELVRASDLARMGLAKLYSEEAARALRRVAEGHPNLRRSDSAQPEQPFQAEKHYSNGLAFFWARNYERAETEFAEAVRSYGKDARYLYYLGLSRLLQNRPGKRAAAFEDFRQARRLEEAGSPEPEVVNAALERVQGGPRRTLDSFRKP
jgi:hypothetical protein